MKLYAILPGNAPGREVSFVLAETYEEARETAQLILHEDHQDGYGSFSVAVYEIATAALRGIIPDASPKVERP